MNNKYQYIKDLSISKDDFIPNFIEITEIIRKRFSYSQSNKIHFLSNKYLNLIKKCSSKEDYARLLLKYFACLQNSHASVYFEKYKICCSARQIDQKIFIDKICRIDFSSSDICEKDEIIEIDGMSVQNWLAHQKKYIGASTSAHQQSRAVKSIFTSYFETERCLLTRKGNIDQEIIFQFHESAGTKSSDIRPFIESRLIDSRIGYIAINYMRNETVISFSAEFNKYRQCANLIIDLRKNEGGDSSCGELIASFLLKNSHESTVSRKQLQPQMNFYKGNLFVLIGAETLSAAESFVADLKKDKSTIIIGSPTAGDMGNNPTLFTTRYGISFRIPIRKPPLVIYPEPSTIQAVQPDYYVSTSLNDYLSNIDTTLNFAVNMAESNL